MNKIYRLVFDPVKGQNVAVSERARARGKRSGLVQCGLMLAAVSLPVIGGAVDLPSGGQVVAGEAQVSYAPNVLTITQSSQNMIVDWNSFNIAAGNRVQFIQPSASAAALNRVTGSDPSVIQGQLSANGQVFLVNPNGVLFTATSQVNVGSLVASTLAINNGDFLSGNYLFAGNSDKTIANNGSVTAASGGTVALIAAKIENTGRITADGGNVLLGAGSRVTLDLGTRMKLQVDGDALNALISNGGAIQADGGFVLLSAKAASELMATAINNTGTVRARTLTTGEKGEIFLLGDMTKNHITVGGMLDASAPNGGDGGFIETSAASVETKADLTATAAAALGKGGEWLIDPYDYTIDATAAGNIKTALDSGTSVTVTTQAANTSYGSGISGNGDITVANAITKTAGGDATLTLRADRNITINAGISSTSGALGLTFTAANNSSSSLGGVKVADGLTLNSNGGKILIGGAGGNQTTAQSNGIGYALNYSDILPAISIGIASKILSNGGDITINGFSSKVKSGSNDTTGVHIFGSAVIDSGYYTSPSATAAASGGDINIAGKYVGGVGGNLNKVFGVTIDQQNGNQGQTTIATSRTTGSIFVDASSSYDTLGEYALNMTTNGLAGNIYFNAYSVANLLFFLNGSLKGVTFTYSPPTSGCRDVYPNCGLLLINSSANNSYLYATYNAVNMSTLPIYVTASATGTKVYDATRTASNLSFSNISILDPNNSGYTSANVTGAAYTTPSANVDTYTTLTGASQDFRANNLDFVLGYKLTANYSITPATASLSATKVYDADANFSNASISASGVNGEKLSLSGAGPALANSPDVIDNSANFLTSLGGMTLADGTTGTRGLASNYVLPSLTARSTNNTVTINPFGVTVTSVSGSKLYDGNVTFDATQLTLGSELASGDDVQLSGSATVASQNVGTYTQWATNALLLSGTAATNYTLDGGSVQATISPAILNLAISKVYNGNANFAASNPYTLTGMVNSESAPTITGGTLTVTSPNVATYTSASANTLALSNANYTLTGGTLGATISAAPLTITPTNVIKTYGQTLVSTTTAFTTGGLQNGETVGAVIQSSAGQLANAAAGSNYGITISDASGGTFTASNYAITYTGYTAGSPGTGGAITVNPAALTITANSASKNYGQALTFAGAEFTSSGLQNSETISSVTLNSSGTAANAGVANGPYSIVANAATGTLSASNYTISYVNGVLTVNPKPLNLTISKAFDGNSNFSRSNSYAFSGMINGQSAPVISSGTLALSRSGAGSYSSSQVALNTLALSDPNYTTIGGLFDIAIEGQTQPVVQYVPTPIIVQPMTPLVSKPSGLNYIPIDTLSKSTTTVDAPAESASTPADTRATNRTATRLTAIGEVRDLFGPTNVRVLNGGINTAR